MRATTMKLRLAASEALPVPRDAEDAYFDALLASSAERRRHESHEQRIERANREQYARWRAWQDALERGVSGRVKRTKKRLSRLDAAEKRYVWFRKRYPRAQAERVYRYLLAAINRINKRKRLKKISKTTLARDLKTLRDEKKIPKYHIVPFIPPK